MSVTQANISDLGGQEQWGLENGPMNSYQPKEIRLWLDAWLECYTDPLRRWTPYREIEFILDKETERMGRFATHL